MAKRKNVEEVGDENTHSEVATRDERTAVGKYTEPVLPRFRQVPLDESQYQRGLMRFEEVGSVFHGWFKRCISKNDPDAVGKYDAIEFEGFPNRYPVLLPGNVQLWEFFNDHVAGTPRMEHLFQITLVERVMDKDKPGEVKFLRFHIGEEDTAAAS